MNKVGILYDSVSQNTGDIAIGIAIEQALAARGVKAVNISPYDAKKYQDHKLIIGGGQLLRDPGDDFYDLFRVSGSHILNSVGLSGENDYSYLNTYSFASARTEEEAKTLRRATKKKIKVVPCTTTIMQSKKYEIPGLDLKPGEKVVGIHLVPDALIKCPNIIAIINNIPHKKVFIPFTHYNCDESFMKSLPVDKSNAVVLGKLGPLELHSVISQMSYTIVSSLHATIFSFTQNVPFVSMYQRKTFEYLKDRKLEKFIFTNQTSFDSALRSVEDSPKDMTKIVKSDLKKVNRAIDDFVGLLKNEKPLGLVHKRDHARERDKLEIEQLKSVVEGRDVLMHNLIYHNIRENEATNAQLRSVIEELNDRLNFRMEV